MANNKPLAKHGISNVKYAERIGENSYDATINDFLYTTNIGLTTIFSTQDVYADNKLLLRIPSDQGYDGQLGSTAPDPDFEVASGMQIKLDDGTTAAIKQTGFKRMALYYEISIETEGGTKVIKVWLLNATFAKANETNATDTAQVTLNDVVYPFTVYGEDVMSTATEKYRDENGVGATALRVVSMPGETEYADFEKSVPKPMKASA